MVGGDTEQPHSHTLPCLESEPHFFWVRAHHLLVSKTRWEPAPSLLITPGDLASMPGPSEIQVELE